eukprot:c18463_g1_i1.p1 GENE.c18463_g1_i1~~c18463_g1_i1.p1  ORF type:complete len:553 (+),score=133.31 c18463_g1_i1:27-1685(+)
MSVPASPPVETLQPERAVIRSGWLRKKPPSHKRLVAFKKSRTRFFVLYADNLLQYYNDETATSCHGAIAIEHLISIDHSEHDFVLHSSTRDWELSSVIESDEDKCRDVEAWVIAITSCLSLFTTPMVPADGMSQERPRLDSACFELTRNLSSSSLTRPSSLPARSHTLGSVNITTYVRKKVSQKKVRFVQDGFDLDLTYITPRIIAMGFPAQGVEGMYRNPLEQVQKFFRTYHEGHYRLYNLCSEKQYNASLFESVAMFPFDDHHPPKLALVDAFCENVASYLAENPMNTVAIHCKAGKGRTGTMIACYLMFAKEFDNAGAALQFYGQQRTTNHKGVTIPSQIRYVEYYDEQLHRQPRAPKILRVTCVRLMSVPVVDLMKGGCTPCLKVYMDKTKVYDQRNLGPPLRAVRRRREPTTIDIDVSAHSLNIFGDCKFVVCEVDVLNNCNPMFHFWINTGYVEEGTMRLDLHQLDGACNDKKGRFDRDFAVEVDFAYLGDEDTHTHSEAIADSDSDHDFVTYDDNLEEEDEGSEGEQVIVTLTQITETTEDSPAD